MTRPNGQGFIKSHKSRSYCKLITDYWCDMLCFSGNIGISHVSLIAFDRQQEQVVIEQ